MAATTSLPVNETQGTATNATRIIGGNWPQVLVGIRTQLQLTTLRERFMDTGEYGLVAWMRADVAVAQPGALSQIVGVVP
jgi:HK97 family phage major capsid protein